MDKIEKDKSRDFIEIVEDESTDDQLSDHPEELDVCHECLCNSCCCLCLFDNI